MLLKIDSDENKFVILRERVGVLLLTGFMAVLSITFGVMFCIVSDFDTVASIFGAFFILMGILLLIDLPRFTKRMKRRGGAEVFIANHEGIAIAPILNMEPVKYAWQEIEKIAITRKLKTIELSEKGYNWNEIVVFLKSGITNDNINLLNRSRKQLWKSAQGNNMSVTDFPKNKIQQVKNEITRFADSTVEVGIYSEVILDYKKRVDTCIE